MWMGRKKCVSVSSFGSLKHFREENKVMVTLSYKPANLISLFSDLFYSPYLLPAFE